MPSLVGSEMCIRDSFDDGRVQTANVAVRASTVSANIVDHLIFMFTAKRSLCFRQFLEETAETDVSDQRGRRKTAELHTSGAKRAATGRGGKVVRAGQRLGGGVGGWNGE